MLALTLADARADWQLRPVSAGRKLTASKPGELLPFRAEPVVLRAARGEWESFQFVVTAGAKPIENLRITPNGLATIGAEFIESKRISLWRENYVFVEKPSGNRELRPLWWPDALLPIANSTRIEARHSMVFWATIRVPADAVPGDYFGELDVTANADSPSASASGASASASGASANASGASANASGASANASGASANRRLALTLRVENRVLPAPTFRGSVAVYYDVLRDWYAKNLGQTFADADWETQKRRYYEFLLDYRVNAYDLPVSWNSPLAAKYLRDPRVLSVRVPPLDNPEFAVALDKLRATQTLNKAIYYWIDEPTDPARYAAAREATAKLRVLGIKHLVTAHPNAQLSDSVDIWAPNVGDFFGIGGLDFAALKRERDAGRETWLYTMFEPKYPTPTWLLDDDGPGIRAYGAFWRRHGFNGFVYSMAHGWGPKPLENLQSFGDTNGDGTLIYPGEIVGQAGPLPSMRLMRLRDAIEDYELNRTPDAPVFPRDKPTLPPFEIGPGAPVTLDGNLTEWPVAGFVTFARGDVDNKAIETDVPATKMWARHDAKFLYLAFRLQDPQSGDWVAAEIAPVDVGAIAQKWRFVATLKGKVVAEKWTRDGRFEAAMPAYQVTIRSFAGFANVEMQIPLAEVPAPFRLSALRRTQSGPTRVVTRAFPDADDPFLMPRALLNPSP